MREKKIATMPEAKAMNYVLIDFEMHYLVTLRELSHTRTVPVGNSFYLADQVFILLLALRLRTVM